MKVIIGKCFRSYIHTSDHGKLQKKEKKKKVQLSATEVMPQFSTLDTQYSFAL